ncbi:MAG TPA: 1-deoxy-D-xylulose-5-phosphate reductoisomerase [Smithella sp.]|nr:1-deoxy-D-xylulose-5-phosphate reductoisomerase [Smithella sp.]HOG90359.1 1-deoxy-D-xylulose-5-phosphate reductoisomerase [Smithella sp.]HOU50014.1 1-deoxy-D-xylulose-5-phosphate reductoisomerase [Smithella sp.]HQG64984.1 1-deoxy-D-xylulose-5-phosphate reductoisomerase [Smithella sp.]HQH15948.1 1-deoxy-D-xylulose-5-phosphate reductoisomerase [Smithella sp.]
MKKITLLGSTGSIGCSTLDVVEKNPDRFQIVALAAGENIHKIKRQIERCKPKLVSVKTKETALKLREALTTRHRVKILYDVEGMKEVASFPSADIVVSAIAGSAGLVPTLAAIEAGKDIALANKETMVLAGEIVTKKAAKKGINIIPVDSEHSAIFQCLQGNRRENLRKIILTASGGPFLKYTVRQLQKVTLNQTLRHPKWKMGKKITIDSASMMNKGLEIIEAKWLFNVDISAIDVLIHPQSIVHSMVEFIDGAFLAQMGVPDMKIPIAYALSYPERMKNDIVPLNLAKEKTLEFYQPDVKKFPCLDIACHACLDGGTAPAVLNASDEIAVEAFMQKMIRFVDIPVIIEKVLNDHKIIKKPSLEDILSSDRWARIKTKTIIERMIN